MITVADGGARSPGALPRATAAWPRPASVSRPTVALAAVALALFGIARTTGSGWLIVLLTMVAATVALAFVLPAFGLARTTVGATAPRDGTVGRELEVRVALAGGSRAVKLRAVGFDGGWVGAIVPAEGLLAITPARRGVVDVLVIDVRSAAPLGLVWWTRRYSLALPAALEVGPHPTEADVPLPTGDGLEGRDGRRLVAAASDSVRSTRDYLPGDPIKLVHWAATARFGEVMVKELESVASPAVAVAVELDGPDHLVERAASRAAGVANAALRLGLPLVMLTAEARGPRSGPVGSPREVGRRLARAVAGPLPAAPRSAVVISVRARGEREGREDRERREGHGR
ncbi:MAG TPA: DUF58 domain-containing protein [Acidimicrobiales bacterium]|nr:DUF58 domain-containing protein [Acidimicrobiales bacterium]